MSISAYMKTVIYAHFLKIESQNLDYLIVLRYNFACCRN